MNDASTEQLKGSVLRFINIAVLLPQYKGRVGLDIRIRQGRLHMGQNIKVSGPGALAELKITGIELKYDPEMPDVVRIHCDLPAGTSVPDGHVAGWTFSGE